MPYEISSGSRRSPVILHVPHASRAITREARPGLLPSDAELGEELDHLTDAYTDEIARRAADDAGSRPWIFENRWSRLVVDPERFPGPEEEMLAAGMGPVYTRGWSGRRLRDEDPARDEMLIKSHFLPYAEGMAALVGERLAAAGRALIIDVHSYSTVALPYELHGDGPRPQICLGVDRFHTPEVILSAARKAFSGYEVGINSPFAGAYVPLELYGRNPAVAALMIEIRRDTYMREPGGGPTAGLDRIAGALTTLVDSVA